MHQWAPPGIKMSYDNVGLLLGDPTSSVTKILVCLDVTEAVVAEAIEKNCELIVSHHPLIFDKVSAINPTNEQGRIIYRMIQNNIALLAAHTNLRSEERRVGKECRFWWSLRHNNNNDIH